MIHTTDWASLFADLQSIQNRKSMPYRKGPMELQRYMVPAGKTIFAYRLTVDDMEEYVIQKDMFFTENEIIPQPGTTDPNNVPNSQRVIRVSLDDGEWTFMDVEKVDVCLVELHPMS